MALNNFNCNQLKAVRWDSTVEHCSSFHPDALSQQ